MAADDSSCLRPGTFYGVGVGPGDPELLTLKAHRVLRQVPVVCVPKGRPDSTSYARAIVAGLLDPSRQEVLEFVLPMTNDLAELEAHWSAALEQIATRLLRGQDVAFVTEGDPFIYSTFIDLHRLMKERYATVPVEIIPGVSSLNAAAAAAGIPLVDGAERLLVLPSAYEDGSLPAMLEQFDTVVLFKVNRSFGRVLDALERLDLTDRAVYVRRCGSADEQIVRDVRDLRGKQLDYLSLVIVKK